MYCDYIHIAVYVSKISYNKNRACVFNKGAATELSLDVAMNTNESYSITNHNQEHQYDYVYHKKNIHLKRMHKI